MGVLLLIMLFFSTVVGQKSTKAGSLQCECTCKPEGNPKETVYTRGSVSVVQRDPVKTTLKKKSPIRSTVAEIDTTAIANKVLDSVKKLLKKQDMTSKTVDKIASKEPQEKVTNTLNVWGLMKKPKQPTKSETVNAFQMIQKPNRNNNGPNQINSWASQPGKNNAQNSWQNQNAPIPPKHSRNSFGNNNPWNNGNNNRNNRNNRNMMNRRNNWGTTPYPPTTASLFGPMNMNNQLMKILMNGGEIKSENLG